MHEKRRSKERNDFDLLFIDNLKSNQNASIAIESLGEQI